MAVDVDQALLHYTEECNLRLRRQTVQVRWRYETDVYPTPSYEAIDIPFERKDKASLLEHRRVQQIRERTQLLEGLFAQRAGFAVRASYTCLMKISPKWTGRGGWLSLA